MNKDEARIRINKIKSNMAGSRKRYDDGKITRAQLDTLEHQGKRGIKEIKEELRNG